MTNPIRWGILGLGNIAHKFAEDLKLVQDAQLVSVGSRNPEKARIFASKYGALHAFGSYEELVQSDDIDIVYIATPHTYHMENTLQCLEHGKAVLCEKPFAINAKQAEQMIATARSKNLFLMDAIWTQFFPFMYKLREILDAGILGKIHIMEADFGFRRAFDPDSRLYNMNLGGGALLDIGIYPVFLAHSLFGVPSAIQATGTLHPTGADIITSVTLKYPDGLIVNTFSTIFARTKSEAKIYGELGGVRIFERWHEAFQMEIMHNGTSQILDFDRDHRGYVYEIEAVHTMLRENRIEHPLLSHQFTLELMQTLDSIRDQIGLKYPGE